MVRQVTYVEQVCNRKETTWWEPRGQIWTECWELQSSEGHTAEQKHPWQACKGVLASGKQYGKKKSSLWDMSLHLSLN